MFLVIRSVSVRGFIVSVMARALPLGYSSRVHPNASQSIVGVKRCPQKILASAVRYTIQHVSLVGASLLRDHNHVEDRRGAGRKVAKVA